MPADSGHGQQSSQSMLKVSDLTSGYRRVAIVQDISFSVNKGEILAVVGRNGVGKTTLMKALIGSLRTFVGTIQYKGEDVTGLRPSHRARRGMGYVPQGRGIFARMSVDENLSLGAGIGGNGRPANYDRVHDYFPVLKERRSQDAGSLSGGEQQQLAIGRILVGRPDLILLDEPSEGIQPNLVQQLGVVIQRLQDEEGLTVVIVEQNLDLIRAVADRCVVVDKGTIVAQLSANEFANPDVAKRYLAI